jgi:copper resistance protein B
MKKLLLGFITVIGLGQTAHAGMEDDPLLTMFVMDKFEVRNDDENTRVWEGSFWIGHDINKLYIYSTGEATAEGIESSQNELVYSRAIAPFWDLQAGLAYDENGDASQTWGEVAIAGLAPYYFETRAALLIGSGGNIGLRVDAEYEALLTQKLILTPSIEADFYTKDDSEMQLGSGLSSLEAGVRLRYEFVREFAPYIGIEWEKTFGNTRDYNAVDDTRAVFGVRFWF